MIFVTGFHRSGTSLVAGTLRRAGVEFGSPVREIPADEINPRGYNELRPVAALNDAFLHAAGGTWKNPPSARLKPTNAARRHVRDVLAFCSSRDSSPEFLKDPRFCFTLPLWAHGCEDLLVVIRRDPERAARSLELAQGVPMVAGLKLCQRYQTAAETEILSIPGREVFEATFDSFLHNAAERSRLLGLVEEHLGRKLDIARGLRYADPRLERTK